MSFEYRGRTAWWQPKNERRESWDDCRKFSDEAIKLCRLLGVALCHRIVISLYWLDRCLYPMSWLYRETNYVLDIAEPVKCWHVAREYLIAGISRQRAVTGAWCMAFNGRSDTTIISFASSREDLLRFCNFYSLEYPLRPLGERREW